MCEATRWELRCEGGVQAGDLSAFDGVGPACNRSVLHAVSSGEVRGGFVQLYNARQAARAVVKASAMSLGFAMPEVLCSAVKFRPSRQRVPWCMRDAINRDTSGCGSASMEVPLSGTPRLLHPHREQGQFHVVAHADLLQHTRAVGRHRVG